MTDQPETLDLRSHDIADERRSALLQLFPEVITEGGKIDFDRLKLALGQTVDVGKERYGMNWPGKAGCFSTIQAPSMGTLRPCPGESVDFDTTENLIIEGDNLEVLKLLQKSYLGKVKMIYIDPPYNTGHDFIYPDNYTENLQTYLEYTGQVDAEGRKFGTNTDTEGRFHSKWLTMMYPRLFLARNLLRKDGAIFVSIDDKELPNLIRICDEIFGEGNRVGIICWKNVTDNNPTLITPDNEFIICYARTKTELPQAWKSRFSSAKELMQDEYERLVKQGLKLELIQTKIREFISDNEESVGFLSRYKLVDEHGVYTGSESVHNPRSGGYDFEIIHPGTGKPMRKPANGYRFPKSTYREMEQAGVIIFGPDEKRIVKIKKYLEDYEDSLRSVIALDGRLGSYELKRLFSNMGTVFTNPKPAELLESLISFSSGEDDLILDFFAGSGSTGHAVLELNQKVMGNRRFVLVQLPEALDPSDAKQRDAIRLCDSISSPYTIAEIMKERVRRVISRLNDANAKDPPSLFDEPTSQQDRGFRVFKLDESNFQPWDADAPRDAGALAQQIALHINHIRAGRNDEDILYEILLKSGFPLTTAVKTLTLFDRLVYSVAGDALLICLERDLSLELIRAMADLAPERVVCLDEGFAGNDQLKTNAVQIFRTKGVTSFKTV